MHMQWAWFSWEKWHWGGGGGGVSTNFIILNDCSTSAVGGAIRQLDLAKEDKGLSLRHGLISDYACIYPLLSRKSNFDIYLMFLLTFLRLKCAFQI